MYNKHSNHIGSNTGRDDFNRFSRNVFWRRNSISGILYIHSSIVIYGGMNVFGVLKMGICGGDKTRRRDLYSRNGFAWVDGALNGNPLNRKDIIMGTCIVIGYNSRPRFMLKRENVRLNFTENSALHIIGSRSD